MQLLAIEIGQYGDYYNSRYKQVEQYGAELYILCGNAHQDHWHENRLFIANSMNIDDIAELAILHSKYAFDGVFTFSENSVVATSLIAQKLKLPSISTNAAVNSRNKLMMRNAHKLGKAPHPKFFHTPTLDDALLAMQHLSFPVILKPTLGAASQFVYKIHDTNDLKEKYPIALDGIKTMRQFKNEGITNLIGPNSLIIEEYLNGREFLIEAFTWDGLTVLGSIVDRVTLENDYFDDDVHHAPTDLTEDDIYLVQKAVHLGAISQGLNRSVLHAEIKFHNGIPYIIEIAARPGGGGLDFMARISAGYCPIKSTIDIARGIKPNHLKYQKSHLDTFALCLISQAGKIKNIHIPEHISQDESVFILKIIATEGTIVKRPPDGNDIIGFLGVSGSSRKEAESKAINYSKEIFVEMIRV